MTTLQVPRPCVREELLPDLGVLESTQPREFPRIGRSHDVLEQPI
jgi:hypothetical protein